MRECGWAVLSSAGPRSVQGADATAEKSALTAVDVADAADALGVGDESLPHAFGTCSFSYNAARVRLAAAGSPPMSSTSRAGPTENQPTLLRAAEDIRVLACARANLSATPTNAPSFTFLCFDTARAGDKLAGTDLTWRDSSSLVALRPGVFETVPPKGNS